MKTLDTLLSEKIQQQHQTKLQTLADRHASQMSFKSVPLSQSESNALHKLLFDNRTENSNVTADLNALSYLTQELKAIQSQAIILHGADFCQEEVFWLSLVLPHNRLLFIRSTRSACKGINRLLRHIKKLWAQPFC